MMNTHDKEQFHKDVETIVSRIWETEAQADTCAAYLNSGKLDSPKKEFFEALFYISSIACELRRFIGIEAGDDPYSYTLIDKYLALVLRESMETIPVVFNRLTRVAADSGKINTLVLRKGVKSFKREVKADLDKLNIGRTLDTVRNSVSAHHLDKEGTLGALIAWHTATRDAQIKGVPIEGKAVAVAAVLISVRLSELAVVLRNADDAGYVNELSAFLKANIKTYNLSK